MVSFHIQAHLNAFIDNSLGPLARELPVESTRNIVCFLEQVLIIRKNQQYALICTTPLFYVLAFTCFGSSLPSSGSAIDSSELLEIQIEWVVYTPSRPFLFQVTQKDLRRSLIMAGYCRNM
jgi:hypothetical protein